MSMTLCWKSGDKLGHAKFVCSVDQGLGSFFHWCFHKIRRHVQFIPNP